MKRRRNDCGRNLRRSDAAVGRGRARHAHMRATAMRHCLCRKSKDPDREQQNSHQGDGACGPVAESTEHGFTLRPLEQLRGDRRHLNSPGKLSSTRKSACGGETITRLWVLISIGDVVTSFDTDSCIQRPLYASPSCRLRCRLTELLRNLQGLWAVACRPERLHRSPLFRDCYRTDRRFVVHAS